ncbi:MAG: hypothetical protein AUK63_306 [bacterium P3]|nr:MAG: hypothetical protein AUK63_306 [bacterium P3]
MHHPTKALIRRFTLRCNAVRLVWAILLAGGVVSGRAQGLTLGDYSFATGVAATQWLAMTAPTIIVDTYADDNAYGTFPIGFEFAFCGGVYSRFSVNSNGIFSLGDTRCGTQAGTPLGSGNAAANSPKIVGMARDMSTGRNGYIRYQTLGAAPHRILVCEYKLTYTYGSYYNADVMWQVQLYEDNGQVVLVYNAAPATVPAGYQTGMAAGAGDVLAVNTTAHTTAPGPTSTTCSVWPGAWRYYVFTPAEMACGYIASLHCLSTGTNSAFISWSLRDAPASARLVIEYDDDPGFASPEADTIGNTPPFALTGLAADTRYYVRATVVCDEGSTTLGSGTTLQTKPYGCLRFSTDTETTAIGDGNSTNNYLWGYSYYRYSLSQQIYRQGEMGGAKMIHGMAIRAGIARNSRNISIYLAHTDQESVDNWLTPEDLTLVWSGTARYAASVWNDIVFSTPFYYNGTDNLLLVIVDNTGSYNSSPYNSTYVHSNTGYSSRYAYNDNTAYDPTRPPSGGSSISYRNNVRWYHRACEVNDECAMPAVAVDRITPSGARIGWAPGDGAHYTVYLSEEGASPVFYASTTEGQLTLTGLESDTRYRVYVLPDCAADDTSRATRVTFRTDCDMTAGTCIVYDDLTSCRTECRYGAFSNPDANVGVMDYGSGNSDSRHTVHRSLNERDPRTGNQLRTVPEGYASSVRLGNWSTGAQAESIRYRYTVDTAVSDLLILKYAAVLEDPNHSPNEQPRFTFRITDEQGDELNAACYSADFIANSSLGWNSYSSVLWKDWTTVGVALTPFHGQTIYIKLTTYDCSLSAHYGYAYFVIDCGTKQLLSSDCGDVVENTYTAPSGFNYRWYSAAAPDVTLSAEQSFHITQEGTYHCDLTFIGAGNTACSSTLTAIAGSRYPTSRFGYEMTDTLECGVRVNFNNNSVISADAAHTQLTNLPCETYLWLFDDGTTSSETHPSHFFSEGTHEVRLVAMLSGGSCADTSSATLYIGDICRHPGDTVEKTVCQDQIPYLWNGVLFESAGTQYDTLNTGSGVDSIVTMTLHVSPVYAESVSADICPGESYTFEGTEYGATGVYTHRMQTAAGCDSLRTLTLTVSPVLNETTRDTVCDRYSWHGQEYGQSGTYTYVHTSGSGCTGADTLYLTVRFSNSGVDEQDVCDSLTWHGTTYTASTDTPVHRDVNAAGCDSTTTLHLTVRHSSQATENLAACDSLTWHGTTYTASTDTPVHRDVNRRTWPPATV